jgi:hypothetical protein
MLAIGARKGKKMQLQLGLSSAVFLVSGLCPLFAQSLPAATLTVTVTGTLGPVLSGEDGLGLSGETVVFTVALAESSLPVEAKVDAAAYSVPAGGVTTTLNGFYSFDTTAPSTVAADLRYRGGVRGDRRRGSVCCPDS